MNRETRRKYKITKEQADFLERIQSSPLSINDGEKAKLNVEQIMSRPDYHKMNEKYKAFVESSKDKVFTVRYDVGKKSTKLVCFEEDSADPKWLFWIGDLIKISA